MTLAIVTPLGYFSLTGIYFPRSRQLASFGGPMRHATAPQSLTRLWIVLPAAAAIFGCATGATTPGGDNGGQGGNNGGDNNGGGGSGNNTGGGGNNTGGGGNNTGSGGKTGTTGQGGMGAPACT